jgi:hypothetical protein
LRSCRLAQKTNHESTKEGKHETEEDTGADSHEMSRLVPLSPDVFFVVSSFRVFVIGFCVIRGSVQRSWYWAWRSRKIFAMRTKDVGLDVTRHRLLEGVLLRLARRPDASEFILRGGMLMRSWFRPVPRVAEDLDFVVTFPFDVQETARRFLPVITDETVADGVVFDAESVRFEGIFLDTGSPGVRVFASGTAGELETDFHIDLTFGPPPRPAPVTGEIPTMFGAAARVRVCRPETVVGQKVQALCHLGMLGWRPKDLNDLRLLARLPLDDADLREAIAAYLADLGRGGDHVRTVFGRSSWWGMKRSSARWMDFVKASGGQDVPKELAGVVAAVAGRLSPILESLP